MSDAIKIAFDFVSFHNLWRTWNVASELRMHRLLTNSGDDVLQLKLTLYHAWKALSAKYIMLKATSTSTSVPPLLPIYCPAAMPPIMPKSTVGSSGIPNISMVAGQTAVVGILEEKAEKKRAAALVWATSARPDAKPDTFTCPISPCERNGLTRSGMINHM